MHMSAHAYLKLIEKETKKIITEYAYSVIIFFVSFSINFK
jgi:hypothetical protein